MKRELGGFLESDSRNSGLVAWSGLAQTCGFLSLTGMSWTFPDSRGPQISRGWVVGLSLNSSQKSASKLKLPVPEP